MTDLPSIASTGTVLGGRHDGTRAGVVDPRDSHLTVLIQTDGAVHFSGLIADSKGAVIDTIDALLSALRRT